MKLKIDVEDLAQANQGPIATTCPHCGNNAVFQVVGTDTYIGHNLYCGQRRCPDINCNSHIFVVMRDRDLVWQHPPSRVAFKTENIPAGILETFDEAITCHAAGCFVAAAIMIRRTLEEICEDRGATGKDLKDRIGDLRTKIVLPQELFDAMDELRLLGNDAAHIEAKAYDQIQKAEIDAAVELTIELLKALYQYSNLLTKMRALKKTMPQQVNDGDGE